VSGFTRLHRGIVNRFGLRADVVSAQQGGLGKIVIHGGRHRSHACHSEKDSKKERDKGCFHAFSFRRNISFSLSVNPFFKSDSGDLF
jgi:hypothetical protein